MCMDTHIPMFFCFSTANDDFFFVFVFVRQFLFNFWRSVVIWCKLLTYVVILKIVRSA